MTEDNKPATDLNCETKIESKPRSQKTKLSLQNTASK